MTKGASLMVEFARDLGRGISLESKTKYSDIDHTFNIFIPFPAFQNPFDYAGQFIDDPATQRAVWRYANEDAAFNPGTASDPNYVIDQGAWNWHRPFTDAATDLQLTGTLETGRTTHNITVGAFLSRTEVKQRDTHSSVLNEFADQPRLVDLAIEDAGPDGQFGTADDTVQPVTQDGLSSAASVYVNNEITSNKIAGYVGDEIVVNDALRIDLGARYEVRQAEVVAEGSAPVGANGEFGDALAVQGFQWGNNEFTRRSLRSTDFAASVGLNYALTDVLNLYAVGSRGYFFPELASIAPTVTPGTEIGDLDNEAFWQGEVGVKAGSPTFSGTAALYYTELNNRFSADPRQDPQTGVIRVVPARIGGSRTVGVELTGAVVPPFASDLRLSSMFTYQGHEYTDFTIGDSDFTGNWIRRQPRLMMQGQASYDRSRFDANLSAKYTGQRYADEANFQELDPYTIVSIGAGYTIGFDENQSLRVGVRVFNAFNSRGLTEGDPRLPPDATIEDLPFFNARPILPRRVTVKLTYNL